MKKYLCIIIAAMLLAMVPTTVDAQTKQKSKTRVERKTTKKQSRKKAKKSTSKNNDNKQQLDYKRVPDDDVKVEKEVDARHDDYDVVRTIKEEIVMEEPTQKSDWNNEEEIYTSVEQMPEYPGGDVAMMKYIQSHIKYPPMAKENNIQGKVVVQFVVLKDGSIGKVKVVRSVDKDLDKEAVRVVKSFPKFTPGRKNGQPVAVWYTLPVSFKL